MAVKRRSGKGGFMVAVSHSPLRPRFEAWQKSPVRSSTARRESLSAPGRVMKML